MREISIRLPFLLPLENKQHRMHYHAKRDVKDQIIGEFMAAGVLPGREPMKFAEIVVWRHSTREPDVPGQYGQLKQLLDVLQPEGPLRKVKNKFQNANPGGLGIILNDSPSHIVVRPLWLKSKLSEQHTMIRIREIASIDVDA